MNMPPKEPSADDLTATEAARLERYAEGAMSPEERAAFEREILANPRLAEAVYSDENLRRALESADEVTRARVRGGDAAAPRRAPRWLQAALPAAALVTFAILAPRLLERSPEDPESPPPADGARTLREPARPAAPAPSAVAVFPSGSFDEPPNAFRWARDAWAAGYRLEVRDETDSLVFSAETADTTFVFPGPALAARRGQVLSWRVVPTSNGKDLVPSAPLRFRFGE